MLSTLVAHNNDLQGFSHLSGRASSLAVVTPQPYDGPATFHVDRAVYRIPHLRVELHPSTTVGKSLAPPRTVVIVLERDELPKAVPAFGISTECGLGRRPPETVPGLLDLHAAVARG
jgi:hypothetical protein